ncbi:hypothetical protein V8F06_007458 [Rhypophila decipiens]
MKLTFGTTLFAIVFSATIIRADSLDVINIHNSDGHWTAVGVWYKDGDIRPVDALKHCRETPDVPYEDWSEICFDWEKNRGHWIANNVKRCFLKGPGTAITSTAGRSTWSELLMHSSNKPKSPQKITVYRISQGERH